MPHDHRLALVETTRLRGTPVQRDDLPYIIAIDSDPTIQRTLRFKTGDLAASQTRLERWLAQWNEHGFGFWVFRNHAGEIVGHGGLFPSQRVPGAAELGYVVRPQYWHAGYATEMAEASIGAGFAVLGVREIIAVTTPDNLASRRVLEKCGLRLESEYTHPDDGPTVRYALRPRGA